MKKLMVLLLLVGVLPVLSGCAKVRLYTVEKERVDQEIPGMTGFAGAQKPAEKKTRQVFVLEVADKERPLPPEPEPLTKPVLAVPQDAGESKVVTESKDTMVVHESNFDFPKMDGTAVSSPSTSQDQAEQVYVVQKDDTLQKISKKFYNSYSKWTKIYDVNKDVIKDPNFVKPGVTLKIPLIDVSAVSSQRSAEETKP